MILHMLKLTIDVGPGIFARCRLPLLIALISGIMACQAAVAQRPPAGRRVPPGPLDGMLAPGQRPPAVREPEPLPADPNEKAPQPDKKYDELTLTKAEEAKYMRQGSEIRRILVEKKFDGNQQMFDENINRYFLGRWTLWKNVTLLPSFRNQLTNYFRQTKSGPVYDRLNTLALDFMNKVVRGNYNPAARINAMLAIGELNSVEPSGNEPAVPLPAALTSLIAAVNDAKLPDAIHAVAMVGVLRHLEAGVRDEAARRSVSEAMLRLVTADPPAGTSAAGQEWIMAQAADALGLLGATGDGNKVFNALVGIVADARYSNRTRCVAARALGRLNYTGATGIDPLAAGAKLARFAADCCTEEARTSKEAAQPIPFNRIKQHLDAVLTALGGVDNSHKGIISLARQPAQQTPLAELQKSIKTLSDMPGEGRDLGPPVEDLDKKLEAWLQAQGGEKGKS